MPIWGDALPEKRGVMDIKDYSVDYVEGLKDKIDDLQATADRRLELLKRIEAQTNAIPVCLLCTKLEVENDNYEHDPDCELEND